MSSRRGQLSSPRRRGVPTLLPDRLRRAGPVRLTSLTRAARGTAATLSVVTFTGWAVLAVTLLAALAGRLLGWVEAYAVAWCGLVVLLVALLLGMAPSPLKVSLYLSTSRVVAGQTALGQVMVTNRRGRRVGSGLLELPIGERTAQLIVPPLGAQGTWEEVFSVVTRTRGVIDIGPAQAVRGDGLGLVRRVSSWGTPARVHVHPRTLAVPFDATGFHTDVEGVTTGRLTSSDVSFHALRDYEPGDDRRHVHWNSTARLGRLVVRQFEETRRSHHLLVVDTRRLAWSGDDLEEAISISASLALADIRRSREVSLRTTSQWLPTRSAIRLLDALAELDPDEGEDLAGVVVRAVAECRDLSALTVVTGPDAGDQELARLAEAGGVDVPGAAIRVRTGASRRRRRVGRTSVVVDCPSLDDLPRLLTQGGLA